jgi:two-component system, OmpR family, sensor histidine kinase CiaH
MFRSAKIRLTSWYLLIIMFISISFSVGVYKLLTNEVERFARIQRFRIEHNAIDFPPQPEPRMAPPGSIDPLLVEDVKERIITTLVFINAGIFLLAGFLGYFLAGRTLKPIKVMLDEQNRFITDTSHELRTPLTALKSSLEVFLRDKDAKLSDAKELIKSSVIDVDSLTDLSNSLLNMLHYQTNEVPLKKEVLAVGELIKELIAGISPIAQTKNIQIINNFKATDFNGDKNSLKELFSIFIDNAIKYGKTGGKVTISNDITEKYMKVYIEDDGAGIDEKDLPHIFDRFYRTDKSRSDENVSGYGLGLSIAKRIVELYKGKIMVESKINVGTKFTVIFPF